ncbi:hypothetical protein EDB92DRAFT_1941926 [Lactarius akahatsu]|uniref:Uncharacterized protein n=1 Tax=Lactarius akahatsu TaxID=416441 RepID=A0AAD4LR63_9AGAM|nr:hypothetical protein EDB92DRAFT_1941926 [Lactarius akahatsu]
MSSEPDKVLQDLLKLPFGPYLSETILNDKSKKRLLLGNLMLSYNDRPTGFDRTEFEDPFVPLNATYLPPIESGSRVLFRGVVSIPAVTHLSSTGIQYLNRDFKERVVGSVLNGIVRARKYSSFSLESVFGLKAKQKKLPDAEQYQVRVLIQGFMRSTASFMRSDVVPDGLLFDTANAARTCYRTFEVVSMDVETYKLSRTFLFRHHTLRTMRDILKSYTSGVPTHKRTPQWFIEHYLRGFAYPPHRRWNRINSIEDAESSDESPNGMDEVSSSRPANAKTHRPRHLRIVHKNEVWSIFASHSEWIFSLVQNHKDLKGEVHGYGWESFRANVPRLRVTATSDKETNGKWGLRDEQEEGGHVCETCPVVNIPAPAPKPKSKSQPTTTTAKKRKRRTKSPPAPPSPKRHHSIVASSSKGRDDSRFDEHLDNIYDSDFSQVSTSSNHSSSKTAALGSFPLHGLLQHLPPEIFTPPTLPANMLWQCPVGGGTCSYVINMCRLSVDNLGLVRMRVPNDSIDYLLNNDWKYNDEQVMTIFYEIVNAHWEVHLRELDIRYMRGGDASSFQWIHPWRQKPWPTKKWRQKQRRAQQSALAMKRESPEV